MRSILSLLFVAAPIVAQAAPTIDVVPVPGVDPPSEWRLVLRDSEDLKFVEIRFPAGSGDVTPHESPAVLALPRKDAGNGECAVALLLRGKGRHDGEIFQVRSSAIPRPVAFGVTRTMERRDIPVGLPVGNTASLSPRITEIRSFPNPVSRETHLQYRLTTPGWVSLRIVGVTGRLVRAFPPEWTTEGYHVRTWDGRDNDAAPVPSGMYFFELASGGSREVQRVLVAR